MKNLLEKFEVGDLKLVLEPIITIDEYSSKIGNDDDIIVLSFTIHDKEAALDFVDFVEKGYEFVLDADVSTSEFGPGTHIVFIEIQRRSRVVSQILKIVSDLEAASGLKIKNWSFQYVTDEKFFPLTPEEMKKHIPLSPKAYKKLINQPLDEMRILSGLPINQEIEIRDNDIEALQHAAGIK